MKSSLLRCKINKNFNYFQHFKRHIQTENSSTKVSLCSKYQFSWSVENRRRIRITSFTIFTPNVIWTFNNVRRYVLSVFWTIIKGIFLNITDREMANFGDNKNVYNHLLFVANMLRNNSLSITTFMPIMNRIYINRRFHLSPSRITKDLEKNCQRLFLHEQINK